MLTRSDGSISCPTVTTDPSREKLPRSVAVNTSNVSVAEWSESLMYWPKLNVCHASTPTSKEISSRGVGAFEGPTEGLVVGRTEGSQEGDVEGFFVGSTLGEVEGVIDGLSVVGAIVG